MSISSMFLTLGSVGSTSNNNTQALPCGPTARSINAQRFLEAVQKGDILITEQGVGGLMGHAAIMISDFWVLEMEGGDNWQNSIPDNNRRIKKCDWYDLYEAGSITVYRNRNANVAEAAAEWAIREYYNPNGGPEKTKHIKYSLNAFSFSTTDPSYCSKLVLQAYYYGNYDKYVLRLTTPLDIYFIPTEIPKYFLSPYTLQTIGTF